MRTYTQDGVAGLLRRRLEEFKTLKALAKESGISAGYLSAVMSGKEPGPKVLRFLGLRRERSISVIYFENGKRGQK